MSAVFVGLLGRKVSVGLRAAPGQPATEVKEATLRGVKWTARHPLYLVEMADGQLEVVDPTRRHVVGLVHSPVTHAWDGDLVAIPANDLTPEEDIGEPWDCTPATVPVLPHTLKGGLHIHDYIDFERVGLLWRAVVRASGRALGTIAVNHDASMRHPGWYVHPGQPLPNSSYLCRTREEVIKCLVVQRFEV